MTKEELNEVKKILFEMTVATIEATEDTVDFVPAIPLEECFPCITYRRLVAGGQKYKVKMEIALTKLD